jgi:spore coat protein H
MLGCATCATGQDAVEFEFFMSKSQYSRLANSSGTSVTISGAVLLVNGDTAEVTDLHSRGNNSLLFRHKSLSVDLRHHLSPGPAQEKFKKFHLLNLVMDRGLWHNRWAFTCMRRLGIFPLRSAYCTVSINGQSQGIYLLVEKPQEAADRLGSPYALRRGMNGALDKEYIETPSKDSAQQFRRQFLGIYKDARNYSGETLAARLEQSMNVDQYLRWLAFNYLIMNGDYSDELYLYINPSTRKFDVIPWDYDDIFSPIPHEALGEGTVSSKPYKLFSLEDLLDKAIAADPVLYRRYLAVLRATLVELSEEEIRKAADQVAEDLKQVSLNKEASAASRHLDKEPFVLEEALTNLNKTLEFLLNRRKVILSELE